MSGKLSPPTTTAPGIRRVDIVVDGSFVMVSPGVAAWLAGRVTPTGNQPTRPVDLSAKNRNLWAL